MMQTGMQGRAGEIYQSECYLCQKHSKVGNTTKGGILN